MKFEISLAPELLLSISVDSRFFLSRINMNRMIIDFLVNSVQDRAGPLY